MEQDMEDMTEKMDKGMMLDKMMMIDKRISITAYLQPPRYFTISTNTSVSNLEQLIRSEFMLPQDAEFKLVNQNGDRVSLEQLAVPTKLDGECAQYFLSFDRTLPRYLTCEPHTVLLREPMKGGSTAMLFNPLLPSEKPSLMCSTMCVNLPVQVQLRRLPDWDRTYFLLEMRVDAHFGVTCPVHDPKASWQCNSFRLKMRQTNTDRKNPPLLPYAHYPHNEVTEMSTMASSGEHSMLGDVMYKQMSIGKDSSSRSRNFSCLYNPHACRIMEDLVLADCTPVDKIERDKREKEKEHVWNKAKVAPKRAEGGYMEWVLDMDPNPRGSKESVVMMDKTFVQTFVFECDGQLKEPFLYEFEVIGEAVAQFSGDLANSDDVFEVVQGQPITCNPGRKRISAVQCLNICVEALPGTMSVCCFKKGEKQPVRNFGLYGATLMEQYAHMNHCPDGPTLLTNGHGPNGSGPNGSGPNGSGPNGSHKQNGHIQGDAEIIFTESVVENPDMGEMREAETSIEIPEKEMMTSEPIDKVRSNSTLGNFVKKLKGNGDVNAGEQKDKPKKKKNRKKSQQVAGGSGVM